MNKLTIAFVVPRYSSSIGGGAETLMRDLALKVSALNDISIHILTTCAIDHRTWDNHFSPGLTVEDNLFVYRFPVDERDLNTFISIEHKMQSGYRLTADEQISWIKNSVNSTALYSFIDEKKGEYDLFFFAPYLFGTTFWGSLISDKSIIVPCLHDEAYAYLPIMRTMLRKAKGVMWNTLPEASLAEKIFNIENLSTKGVEVGLGFEPLLTDHQTRFPFKSYFLYCGRKEKGKGLDTLLKYYKDAYEIRPDIPQLILTGSGSIDFLAELPTGVIDLGFVTEKEKYQLMKDAICLFQPSTNESFSIVLMESWLNDTPVIVNSDCDVTRYHVEQSGGGLQYRSFQGFMNVLDHLLANTEDVTIMGKNGHAYVRNYYSWDRVLSRFQSALKIWTH